MFSIRKTHSAENYILKLMQGIIYFIYKYNKLLEFPEGAV